jgi:Chemotaxis phosphatase CheX
VPELRDQIELVVTECCVDLFSDQGITISSTPDERSNHNLAFCGVIGFTGNDLRGSLLLACSREPLILGGNTEHDIRDWIAELANQMIGRIKNRLMALGTVIYYSTPIILRGEHLAPLEHQPRPQLFHANGGIVSVWFDVDAGPDFTLALNPVDGVALREGETLLF